jgi:apolipoprotein N-acyltransferase
VEETQMSPEMLMAQASSMGLLEWLFLIVLSVPPLFVIWSKRVKGGRKVFWFVMTSLFSWLAYIAFVIVTRDRKDASYRPD